MTLDDLNDKEWHIIETLDGHKSYGKAMMTISFAAGEKGYARRNKFQPDYIMVLARTPKRSIAAWYISQERAAELIKVVKVSPNQKNPAEHWAKFWATNFT